MIKKFKFKLGTGFVGATHKETVELSFPDEATEEEVEEIVEEAFQEWAWDKLDGFWEEID